MAIQIFGIPNSVAVLRALLVLKELNVPYELVVLDVSKGEHKSPESLTKQPFGQIPWLYDSDSDLTLFESRAIARYIVSKYDEDNKRGLLPRDRVGAAKFEEAASFELCKFEPHASELVIELLLKPLLWSQETDPTEVTKHLTALNKTLDVYDGILSKQKYISGEYETLVDLFHIPLGFMLTERAHLDLLITEKRPNVQRWWKEISSRSTWSELIV